MKARWHILFAAIFVLAFVPVLARYLWAAFTAPDRADAIARAFDRTGNATANGSEHETISSRANKAIADNKTWGCVLCKWLDRIDPNHCEKARGI